MTRLEKDEAREYRIAMEIVADAHDEEEQALGWFSYLEDTLRVPFRARCIAERRTSPLAKGDEVQVEGLAGGEECAHEMFVDVRWSGRTLAVPLSQLEAIDADRETQEAIADWHYWVARGYQF
jgi:hypothetical protein